MAGTSTKSEPARETSEPLDVPALDLIKQAIRTAIGSRKFDAMKGEMNNPYEMVFHYSTIYSPFEDVKGQGILHTVTNVSLVSTQMSDGSLRLEAKIVRTRKKSKIRADVHMGRTGLDNWSGKTVPTTDRLCFDTLAEFKAAAPDMFDPSREPVFCFQLQSGQAISTYADDAASYPIRLKCNGHEIHYVSHEVTEVVGAAKTSYQGPLSFLVKYFPALKEASRWVVHVERPVPQAPKERLGILEYFSKEDADGVAATIKKDPSTYGYPSDAETRVVCETGEQQLDECLIKLAASFSQSGWKVKYVTGNDIQERYRRIEDRGEEATGVKYHDTHNLGSCMTGSDASEYTEFYAANPDKVKLAIATRDVNGTREYMRCLVWTTESGRHAIDRVYPTQSSRAKQVMRNLVLKDHPGAYFCYDWVSGNTPEGVTLEVADAVVCMELGDNQHIPYLDSFCNGFFPGAKSIDGRAPGSKVYCHLGDAHDHDTVRTWVKTTAKVTSLQTHSLRCTEGGPCHGCGDDYYGSCACCGCTLEHEDDAYCTYTDTVCCSCYDDEYADCSNLADRRLLRSNMEEMPDGTWIDPAYSHPQWVQVDGEWTSVDDTVVDQQGDRILESDAVEVVDDTTRAAGYALESDAEWDEELGLYFVDADARSRYREAHPVDAGDGGLLPATGSGNGGADRSSARSDSSSDESVLTEVA